MISPAKRPWFRFSLRTLFAVVTLVCLWCGLVWPVLAVRQRQAARDWILHNRGQILYYSGERERWNNRGRVEPAQGALFMSAWREFVGDERATTIAIPDDGTFTKDEISRIKTTFPEAEIWFDK